MSDAAVSQSQETWPISQVPVTDPTNERIKKLEFACSEMNQKVCQSLGAALGYPWYKDDQLNFPGATEANGVCVGEHVAETIADEAARRIREIEGKLAESSADADRLAEALNLAVYELHAIRARDGAPQNIVWDRGHPIQTQSCTNEWWNELTEKCFAVLASRPEAAKARVEAVKEWLQSGEKLKIAETAFSACWSESGMGGRKAVSPEEYERRGNVQAEAVMAWENSCARLRYAFDLEKP